jgi:ubiquinone/menaquinone biosynthesis C-methylase UbiE
MSGFDHFNLIGPFYDLVFGRKKDYEIIKRAEVEEGDWLLDVGGGTGRVAVLFKSITTNIVIVDSARKMLQQADERGICCVQSVSENLPFSEMSFNRIIMVDALHHVKDQKKTLSEMWRLLAPGGSIVIEEGDIKNWFVKLVALGEKCLFMRSHFLTDNQIKAMCHFDESANIEISRKKGVVWIIISKRRGH